MSQVLLKKLRIKNFGPIVDDEVFLEPFTYFIGRNNAGKSHYLRAIEVLLASKKPTGEEIIKLQHDKSKEVRIEGDFEGVQNFTHLVTKSNHKEAIELAIQDSILTVVRILDPSDDEKTCFGVLKDGEVSNPSGFTGNLLKVLPEPISIMATADTVDELKNKENTALSKLKKEAMITFFNEVSKKTKDALASLDEFLHSQDEERRSSELRKFERDLKEELLGEFVDVIPSVEFGLPNEEVIAKEMKIFLDDGFRSEVEQKGHGLQRAILLALLRLLAKRGERYQDRPTPIFLIGELESFLHPYAQKQLADVLNILVDRYQIITTTHSPFIIMPKNISGYRRVRKESSHGARSVAPDLQNINIELIKRHLEHRGNLEGLFADRIILLEGKHDVNFYEKLGKIFQIPLPPKKFTLFVKAGGKDELRQTWKFYRQMGYDDVAIICDLDYLFSNDVRYLLAEIEVDTKYPNLFREHISWTEKGDSSLEYVLQKLEERGNPKDFEQALSDLQRQRIFVLRHGSPERYYQGDSRKKGWEDIQTEADILHADYLKALMCEVLK